MYNSDLIDALFAIVAVNLGGINKIGIAFSGGIDSTLLAMICKNMNIDTSLLTVGFPGSKDIEHSKSVSYKIKMNHKILEIEKDDSYLRKVTLEGAERARASASTTIRDVREIVGFRSF